MKHATEGLARPCHAHDLFIVSGGLQCGNCLAVNFEVSREGYCVVPTGDNKPCPLKAEEHSDKCWIHAMQAAATH